MFKAKSNGKDVWPKLPTMIKPAIERWKINQQIALLKLQSGQGHSNLFNKFKSQKIQLPPPKHPRAARQQRKPVTIETAEPTSRQSASDKPAETETDAAPSELNRPHVPPLCAPTQSRFVEASGDGAPCAWWPICRMKAKECGGTRKHRCKVCGNNGEIPPPSLDELSYQLRMST